MLKSLFFFVLRAALGFLLISLMTMFGLSAQLIHPEQYDSLDDPFTFYFMRVPLIVWMACLGISLVSDLADIPEKETHPYLSAALIWSPLYVPLLVGGAALIWFITMGMPAPVNN